MNTFTLILGIVIAISGLITSGIFVYLLSTKKLKPSIPAFIGLFMAGISFFGGFFVMAQEIENYRGNPENNQHIEGEDKINE